MISRRFFLPWTLRLTRGMVCGGGSAAQDAPDHVLLGGDLGRARDAALPAAALLGQEMVPRGLAAHDLARSGHPEPLGRSAVGLHLGHAVDPFSGHKASEASTCSPSGASPAPVGSALTTCR